MDADSPRLRLSILGIVVFGLFATLFARLYYLQVMAPGDGEVEAANNRIRVIQEEAPRGRLLDAKGRVLVDNRTSLVVTMEPQELKDLEDAVDHVCANFGGDPARVAIGGWSYGGFMAAYALTHSKKWALGLAGAGLAARTMKGLLFGVEPTDPAVFAGVAIVTGAIALLACIEPARRATRVDPIRVLTEQ